MYYGQIVRCGFPPLLFPIKGQEFFPQHPSGKSFMDDRLCNRFPVERGVVVIPALGPFPACGDYSLPFQLLYHVNLLTSQFPLLQVLGIGNSYPVGRVGCNDVSVEGVRFLSVARITESSADIVRSKKRGKHQARLRTERARGPPSRPLVKVEEIQSRQTCKTVSVCLPIGLANDLTNNVVELL